MNNTLIKHKMSIAEIDGEDSTKDNYKFNLLYHINNEKVEYEVKVEDSETKIFRDGELFTTIPKSEIKE